MDSRVLIETWWELQNKKGERYLEYSALGGSFGKGTPFRFVEEDKKPTLCMDGVPYEDGLSVIERTKMAYPYEGPFKLFRIRRYSLVKGNG